MQLSRWPCAVSSVEDIWDLEGGLLERWKAFILRMESAVVDTRFVKKVAVRNNASTHWLCALKHTVLIIYWICCATNCTDSHSSTNTTIVIHVLRWNLEAIALIFKHHLSLGFSSTVMIYVIFIIILIVFIACTVVDVAIIVFKGVYSRGATILIIRAAALY